MKHAFIFNPKSFLDKWRMDSIIDSIGSFFKTQEKPDFSVHISRFPRDSIGHIQGVADKRTDINETIRVYAIGGDEILFDCLNGIIGLPNAELAIVPYGITNDFIRAFGEGKAELFRNIQALVTARAIPTDIIKTGNNYAINNCSVGLLSAVAFKMKAEEGRQGRLRRLAFWNQIKTFLSYISIMFSRNETSHHYDVMIDDLHLSGNFGFINIANGPYFGGRRFALKRATPDDGLLDVALFKASYSVRILLSILMNSWGITTSNCSLLTAKKITLKTKEPVWVHMDGNFFQETNITFEIFPGAVQVVAVNDLSYKKSR